MMRRLSRILPASVAGLLLAVPVTARGQGSLSTLGFGYPVGGLSIRASGTAGAFSEFDALTQSNPASLGGVNRTVASVHAEPELRTLRVGGVSERTRAQRLPLISVIFPAWRGIAVGVSASSFLDRSYTMKTTGTVVLGTSSLTTNDELDVRGAIGTLRGAVGWQVNQRLRVGASGHLYTGDNTVARQRVFADTNAFGSLIDTSRVTYFGTAIAVGGEVQVVKGLVATASYKLGGGLDARVRDTVRTSAHVPNVLAASLRYEGIPGTVFAVGLEQAAWSRMQSLGSSLVKSLDATNWRVGAETAGPAWRGLPVLFRAGFARNQLPFSISGTAVAETRWSGGVGLPIAREFGTLDFSVQRASRTLAGSTAREGAWLLGIGLQIRP